MKRLLLIIYCFSILSIIHAQIIKGALIGGFNMTQVDGDEDYGFHKFGVNAGASAIIPLKDRFSIVMEILYTQKGSYQKTQYPYGDSTGEYKLRLNYAEVPVLIQYADKGGLSAGVGFSYGKLVSVSEMEYNHNDHKVEWNKVKLDDGTYRGSDYDVIADVRLRLYKGFYLDARYSYSMIKIRTRYFFYNNITRYQYNNVISFRLIWVINEKVLEERRKIQKYNPTQ